MKISHFSALTIAAFTTILLCSQAPLALAGGAGFSQDVMSSKEVIDTQTDLGYGKFKANPFHVTVSLRGGYDDNVDLSSFDSEGSFFSNLALLLTYNMGSPRTRISLSTGGGVTYYFDRENGNSGDDYDVNAHLAFGITHKATPRLTLAANVYASYQSQPDFDSFNRGGLGFSRQNQDFFYSTNKFSIGYAWAPRFATLTSYTLGYIDYDSAVLSLFEDRVEHTIGNEFRFLVWPTTTLVAEYRFGLVDYTETNLRGSHSHFFLAGFDHNFNPRFSVSARGGVEFRQFDDGVVEGDRTSPYFEATANYAIAQSTSVSWTNRYSLEEPDSPDIFSRTTYRSALSLRHNFTSRIVAGLNAAYQHDSNDGALGFAGFDEDAFDLSLTARYAITRNWSIDAGYHHTQVISDDALFREFSRNRVYGGVSFYW